jgi:magnesium-dependent phosphatase 1
LTPAVLEEAKTKKDGYILTDRTHTPMQVFKGASHALREIEKLKQAGYDIQAAVASKTDVESYAKICMDNLVIDDEGTRLISCFENGKLVEIAYGSKTGHLKNLQRKTGIPFNEMAFFDNEYGNIRSVSSLGVKCYYTPRGMTHEAWEKAKEEFGIDTNALELSESDEE